jgi:hypothetical protein
MVLARARAETQVAVVGTRVPARVTIDGTVIPRSASARALRSMSQGWLVARGGSVSGVVLKLAPRGGRATVELSYDT